MSIKVFIMFLYSLNITPLERTKLTACTLYNTKANTVNVLTKLCKCSLTNKIRPNRLVRLCEK